MTDMQDLIGQTLGQYKIIEQIGEGGMATVFKAYQPGLNREVAIKILPPFVAQKPGFTERFTREAQAIGNLHHPNILPVHDSGQDKGYGYLVMRYVPNANTLAKLMRNPLTKVQINQWIAQIASALDHAHEAGIIHRDIKPSNILMDGDWVLLSDFGLAKMMGSESELTGTGVGVGTPAYMSPEQAKGEKVDHRTDIYSLGIILFEMLTGQVPHKAETPLATVVKRINEPLPKPRTLNPDLSEAVEQVLLKALAPNPDDRFNSAGALATALRLAFEDAPAELVVDASDDTFLAVPVPAEPVKARISQAEPARGTEGAAAPAAQSKTSAPTEIVILTLLGLVSLCGISGTIFALMVPDAETGRATVELAPACLSLTVGGLGSMAMIWFRKKAKAASAWLAIGIVLWFVGIQILGWGVFAVFNPNDDPFMKNLGFSLALCFAPGGFLTLLGLGMFFYDQRRGHALESPDYAPELAGSAADKSIRAGKLKRAAEYKAHIMELVKQMQHSAFSDQVAPITATLDQWENQLHQLVERLDTFEANHIIQRDLREVPAAIARLEAQIEHEINPQMRSQMQETLAGYKAQLQQLDSLVMVMRRTELDVDETLADIGTIYSQLQLLGAKDIDSSRAKRLSAGIQEQANRMSDLLAAMDDVYDQPGSLQADSF